MSTDTESPFTMLPMGKQQIRFIGQSNSRINIATGSIRSGKTIASLFRWLMYVATAPHGELVIVGRTSTTVFRNVFAPLMDPAITGDLADKIHYVEGASSGSILGRRVWIIGANDVRAEGRLRGLTCAGAYVDEATLVPKEFFMQLLGRMSVPGSKMFATTNPDNPGHYLMTQFIDRAYQLDLSVFKFTLNDNPSLTDEIKNAYESEFTGLWYRRFILGEWVAAEGSIYDMWDPKKHVIPWHKIPAIQRWISVGVDYGTTNPFHALALGIGSDSKLYVPSDYRYDSKESHKQLSDSELSEAMRVWLNRMQYPMTRLIGVRPERICVDPSAASFKVQLYRDGLTAVDADNDVSNGIRTISNLLSGSVPKLYIVDTAKAGINEMSGYSWNDSAAAKGNDVPNKVNDHFCDALRYAVHTTRSQWQREVMPAAIFGVDRDGWAA